MYSRQAKAFIDTFPHLRVFLYYEKFKADNMAVIKIGSTSNEYEVPQVLFGRNIDAVRHWQRIDCPPEYQFRQKQILAT